MWRGILGKKLGMTQFFTEDGKRVGVTVIEAGPCPILQVKSKEVDGYDAYQLGYDTKKENNTTKAIIGHCKKTGNAPVRFIREIRTHGAQDGIAAGNVITLEGWEDIKEVQVTSKSKGKGFQGVMKRHHFRGLCASHGVKTSHRCAGSTGSLTPARTPLNVRMPGHMGSDWITQKGLRVAKVIVEKNLIFIQGSVPGANGAHVLIRPAQPFVPQDQK